MTNPEIEKLVNQERYHRQDGKVIIEAGVRSSRQIYNERDPSPFRERDLDENFVTYVLSSVQEFPLKTDIRLRILIDENEASVDRPTMLESFRAHFVYESQLMQANVRKQFRDARSFLLIGLFTLSSCLGIAHFIETLDIHSAIAGIIKEGFVISGWVAMWRPIEAILYDWWPLIERKRYLMKVAAMNVDIVCKRS